MKLSPGFLVKKQSTPLALDHRDVWNKKSYLDIEIYLTKANKNICLPHLSCRLVKLSWQ